VTGVVLGETFMTSTVTLNPILGEGVGGGRAARVSSVLRSNHPLVPPITRTITRQQIVKSSMKITKRTRTIAIESSTYFSKSR